MFLEYLAYKVIPEWNRTEQILSDAITYHTDRHKDRMYKQLKVLHALFTRKELMEFMVEHLRFPRMKVTVIDYSNARTKLERIFLDAYRKKMGIPTTSEKAAILKKMQSMQQKF